MTKYLLRFDKHGYVRFLSHLDLGRLFRRAIKKAEINVDFSSGFNPHEKINIVQPLSLGFESDSEYFEITLRKEIDKELLKDSLNESMPKGMKFFDCKIIDPKLGNLSNLSYAASYTANINIAEDSYNKLDIDGFLNRNQVFVKKRDKKTKTMVDKDVKSLILGLKEASHIGSELSLDIVVRCATNESLNPNNLIKGLFDFSDIDYEPDKALICRKDLMYLNNENELVSLFYCDEM